MKSLHLVDSIEYVSTNCYQHQLWKALKRCGSIETVPIGQLGTVDMSVFSSVVMCLKQRTVHRCLPTLASYLKDKPVVFYDQDPWESYRDGSPFRGTYESTQAQLNLKSVAVTTKWWSDYINSKKVPATFVKMWMLPEYCKSDLPYDHRAIDLGFIGTIHPHRRRLFDKLASQGVDVHVRNGGLSYQSYLASLSNLRTFIHSEDSPVVVDGEHFNMSYGLWIKDVEAASRGCFSIRNRSHGHETYFNGIETVYLYDDESQIAEIVQTIKTMDPLQRQAKIETSVEFIKNQNEWETTAKVLLGLL